MNTNAILRILQNAGFNVLRFDDTYVYIEDPACILRSFETFLEYAWVVVTFLTGILLFGWAISMIRGAKNDIFTNLRNLTLMFGTLAAVGPIVNLIWGDNLFARGCRQTRISVAEVTKILDAKNWKLGEREQYNLYEQMDIYDSGITHTVPINSYSTETSTQSTAVRIEQSGRDIIYIDASGHRTRRSGGSLAWRNNNPGNIRDSKFARRMGAIGAYKGFAIFPDEQTGMAAITELLRTNTYRGLTLAGAISKYAPPSENNTASYHKHIQELTGISVNKRMSDMTTDELKRITIAIRTIEGWKPGTITKE